MAKKRFYIDVETRSDVNLKTHGLANYLASPNTSILCIAWALDDSDVHLVTDFDETYEMIMAVEQADLFVAHNVLFDYQVFHKFLGTDTFTPLPLCTKAKALACGLPASLEEAAEALGLAEKKDKSGKLLMLKLSKPKALEPLTWHEEPEKLQKLYEYCIQDVKTMRALDKALPDLSEKESKIWEIDWGINTEGLAINLPAVEKAIGLVEAERAVLNNEATLLTDGFVQTLSEVKNITTWLGKEGVELDDIRKTTLDELDLTNMPEKAQKLVSLRKSYGKSSVAKLEAMKDLAKDSVVYDTLVYHQAITGRWAGKGIQIQNFPRATDGLSYKSTINDVLLGNKIEKPIETISKILRAFIVPKRGQFIGGDFSGIEARILAWLSGQEDILDVFRNGVDVYKHTAAKIFSTSVESITDKQRQIGKVATLALGYQGGINSFLRMSKLYGVEIDKFRALDIVSAWRQANREISSYWGLAEFAASEAVLNPHEVFVVKDKVRYVYDGDRFLQCHLPSGRIMRYFKPAMEKIVLPKGKEKIGLTYEGKLAQKKGSFRIALYGGLLVENITQAVARDILADAMLRCNQKGLKIVTTIHDEIITENGNGLKELMEQPPEWAKDLPLEVKEWRNDCLMKSEGEKLAIH